MAALVGTLAVLTANPCTMFSYCSRALHITNLDPDAVTKWTVHRLDADAVDEVFSALHEIKGGTIDYTYGYPSHVVFGIEYQSHDRWPKRLTLVSRKGGVYRIMETSIGADTHEIDVSKLAVKGP